MDRIIIRVAPLGGDCATISEALTIAAPYTGSSVCIALDPGVYRERIVIRQPMITLQGSGRDKTRLVYGDYARELLPGGERRGTFRTPTLMVDADDFTARGLTVENDAGPGALAGQALAVYADGDRLFFDDCDLIGHQDTLFTAPLPPAAIEKNGFRGPKEFAPRRMTRQLYRRCRISGEVDFIFGGAACWFEECELVSLETGREINGYVTAPSTPEGEPFGYVFNRCRFTGDCRNNSVYLGRPWRDHGRAVILRSKLGPHIRREGWHDWDKPHARTAAFFREYGCSGAGALGTRPDWVGTLTPEEADRYTPERVLGPWAAERLAEDR